ncbi:MAG TPA: HEAT repeat domain-containing protein, partial [Acidobacteriaceae bacterium]
MTNVSGLRRVPYRALHISAVIALCAAMHSATAQDAAKPQDSAKQQDATKPQDTGAKAPQAKPQEAPANPDSAIAGERASTVEDLTAGKLPASSTRGQRVDSAWAMVTEAAADSKRPQTRVQALAALGMLRTPHSARLIAEAMRDSDLDVRTAAALAAGQSGDRSLTTPLRSLLDDSEPQVVFTAALTLWKMNDRSGE